MTDMHGVPGETSISYSGPPELRESLPQRDPAGARALAADLAARAERAAENALSMVGRLRPPYPSFIDGLAARLVEGARRASALAAGSGDPFGVLEQVRALVAQVESGSLGLAEIARGVIQGRQR